jgi:hypothetical protein
MTAEQLRRLATFLDALNKATKDSQVSFDMEALTVDGVTVGRLVRAADEYAVEQYT